ncbi:metal-dependent hydrolase [Solibacillus silvestris]
MDSGTHFVMGIAIGGLALVDPTVASHSMTFTAVMAGTIIGQQAPDIDTVLKLRNNAVYIRHHRGITHSIPAVLLWPLLITGVLALILPDVHLFNVWLWTQIAVFLHVFVDIFNAYGTQALRPFSKKWVALGVINTFDPFIFTMHCIGILLWLLGTEPVLTFTVMYIIIFFYYILRFALQKAVKTAVHHELQDEEFVIVAPTMRFFHWKVAAKSKTHFYVGRAYRRSVNIYDKFEIEPIPKTELVEKAIKDPNLDAFLSFSPLYRWEISELESGVTELRLIDLRYRSNDRYPFVAVAHLDEELNIVNSYTGWIFTEEKLQKRLQIGAGND